MNKNLVLIVAGRFLQAFLSVIALRVMTAYLSPAQVGNVFLVLSFTGGFGFFLVNPVGMYINRRLHAWQADKSLLPHFSLFNVYMLLVSVLSVIGVVLVKKIGGVGAGIAVLPFAVIVASYVYANTWNMTLVPALNMLGYRTLFVYFSVLTSAFGLVFSVVLVRNMSSTGVSWLSGQVAAMAGLAVVAFISLKNRTAEKFPGFLPFHGKITASSFSGLRDFALPLAGATFFMWLQNQSYRLIVERLAGAEFLGFLAVGLGIASSLAAITESLVQQVYFPGFYKKINSGGPEQRRLALTELAEKSIPVYIVLAFFTAALSAQFTGLLVDPKFKDASYFVVFGAFIEFFRMSSNIVSSSAHSEMRTTVLFRPYVYGGLITALAVYIACGFPGKNTFIPLGMVFGGFVTFLAMKYYTARLVPMPFNRALVARALLFSSVFLLFLFGHRLTTPFWSAGMLCLAGTYFLAVVYFISRDTAGSRGKDGIAGLAGEDFQKPPDMEDKLL